MSDIARFLITLVFSPVMILAFVVATAFGILRIFTGAHSYH